MRWLALVLIVFALLSIGCAPLKKVVLDPCVPHAVSKPAKVTVWCRGPDTHLYECTAEIERGWYVAGPLVVDGPAEGCKR